MYYDFFKRIFDFLLSLFFLILLSPVFLITSIVVILDSKGPIFFKQIRVGKDLCSFKLFKFRTMTNEKRKVGTKPLIGKVEGVTRSGYYLRRFKIDELPQLINVLLGQMSLIGPRPSVPEQLQKMTLEEKKRYDVRPGLTGLAQVSGNIHLPWKERYKLDLIYVKNISFFNDLKILFRTIFIVIMGEDKFLKRPLKMAK